MRHFYFAVSERYFLMSKTPAKAPSVFASTSQISAARLKGITYCKTSIDMP